MIVTLFESLVIAHIVSGSIGLLTMWIPIFAKKGAKIHRVWGRLFARTMTITGIIAIGISTCSLLAPLETHTFSEDAAFIRGVFGWMMLYLACLTIMLSRYGLGCIRNRHNHAANKNSLNLLLQLITFVTAANCALQGYQLDNPLLIGISIVGITAAILNTRFIFQHAPPNNEWLIQHTRGLVGAGISVYTAFLAFGAVNLLPAYAFNPLVWATPTVLGVTYLLYHQGRITLARNRSSQK